MAWIVLNEDNRQALRYIIRNTALPQSMRNKAQLELAQMHSYTRPTQIKNRCVMGGVARGVFRAFRMGRVSDFLGAVRLQFVLQERYELR